LGTNIRRILDILESKTQTYIDESVILLDFKKAFDSVEWVFMYSTLKKINFGNNFINWMQILYSNPTFRIKNNGWISKDITMSRGIRQGCPVSALLFILVVEIMACNIRDNKDIKGIKLNVNGRTYESNISQYADDSALTLTDKISIYESIREIKRFSAVSGLHLNMNKCEGLWVNASHNVDCLYRIHFYGSPVKYLGVYIGNNTDMCFNMNWEPKIEKLKENIDLWNKQRLNIFEKVDII
jgi:hypothetical protein